MTRPYTLSALEVRERQLGEVAQHNKYRTRILPQQITAARAKLRALEREARARNMHHLLETNDA